MTASERQNLQGDTRDKAAAIVGWLEEKKARDIVALDVSRICSVTEVIVVVTAGNPRHAKALADTLRERCKESGFTHLGMEGYVSGQWILVDINDVVVHIFQQDLRSLYDIEGLWSEGLPLDALSESGA